MVRQEFFKPGNEVTPANLGEAIQQAIEIEISTIPVYLYTYYSINRTPNQDAISGIIAQKLIANGVPVAKANNIALEISMEFMVYANKAGALIMSVAIEEMLHMALSSNLKQALAGLPELYGKSPAHYPAILPGHEPEFKIDLAALSLDQLITFLKIESPDPLPDFNRPMLAPIKYTTIGDFYNMIKTCIQENDLPFNTHSAQLIPGRGYYASNNIDTVYYDKKHNPHFVNADDSGDLIYVTNTESAVNAINTIIDQGEGNQKIKGFNPDGTIDCPNPLVPGDFDDASKEERCHFVKFREIYCEYKRLSHKVNGLGIGEIDINSYFVINVPTNPRTSDYPEAIQPLSTLTNAIYTYIFVMVENCYVVANNTQYELFMFGIHKSMIFILNSIISALNGYTYKAADGKHYTIAPTFEDYPFGLFSSPKQQLVALYNTVVVNFPEIAYLGGRINDLPDVPIVNNNN